MFIYNLLYLKLIFSGGNIWEFFLSGCSNCYIFKRKMTNFLLSLNFYSCVNGIFIMDKEREGEG